MRKRLVLRLLYVFHVCLSVRPHLSHAQYVTSYVYYATAVYSSFWRFAGQATANEGTCSCELPRMAKTCKDPVLVTYSY